MTLSIGTKLGPYQIIRLVLCSDFLRFARLFLKPCVSSYYAQLQLSLEAI